MAGDWIKIEMATPDKPEVVTMAGALGIDQDAVIGKLIRIWMWTDQQSLNGCGISVTTSFIDRLVFCNGFADAMRKVGWIEGRDSALTFPNFDRHNGQTAKLRAESARRMKKSRQIRCDSVAEKAQQKAQPEKRREEKSIVIESTTPARQEFPTLVSVHEYARSAPVPISEDCVVAFYDTQEASGWITKHGHPIADWRAFLRRYASHWNENEKAKIKGHSSTGQNGSRKPSLEDLMGGRSLSISKAPIETNEPFKNDEQPPI